MVILTSDNGPVIDDGYDDRAEEDLNGHRPAGPLRGGKCFVYEGDCRSHSPQDISPQQVQLLPRLV